MGEMMFVIVISAVISAFLVMFGSWIIDGIIGKREDKDE